MEGSNIKTKHRRLNTLPLLPMDVIVSILIELPYDVLRRVTDDARHDIRNTLWKRYMYRHYSASQINPVEQTLAESKDKPLVYVWVIAILETMNWCQQNVTEKLSMNPLNLSITQQQQDEYEMELLLDDPQGIDLLQLVEILTTVHHHAPEAILKNEENGVVITRATQNAMIHSLYLMIIAKT